MVSRLRDVTLIAVLALIVVGVHSCDDKEQRYSNGGIGFDVFSSGICKSNTAYA